MRFDVLTLFPGIFSGYLTQSLLKRAIQRGLVEVYLHNIRDWSRDKHHKVDDRPYGGGPGMVIRVEPVVECVEAVQSQGPAAGHVVLLSPQGQRLDQALVEQLAEHPRLLLLCGRYEGFDERVRTLLQPQEVSIGDYVLNGGEVAAMVVMDAVMRLVPGVLGDETSSRHDSFAGPERLLEFAQYTRPPEYRGQRVPEVLLSGDHAEIARWREAQRRQRTQQRRGTAPQAPATPGAETARCPSDGDTQSHQEDDPPAAK
jgi:tRNA (guanine37-N1)-methyltransferase